MVAAGGAMKDAFGKVGKVSIKAMIPRLSKLFTKPAAFWEELAPEPGGVSALLPTVLVLVIAVGIANFLGGLILAIRMSAFFGTFLTIAIVGAAIQIGLGVLTWYVLALLINAFAGTFEGRRGMELATKVALGTLTPMWIGSLLTVTSVGGLRMLGVLAGFGYGVYVCWLGLQAIVEVPRQKAGGYTAAVIALLFVISGAFALIVGTITGCIAATAVASALS